MTNPIGQLGISTTHQVLPSQVFDTSFTTASNDIRLNQGKIRRTMLDWGVDLHTMESLSKASSVPDARQKVRELHDACTMLFLQWQFARESKDRALELAIARIFNRLTKNARLIHDEYAVFDTAHLTELAASLKAELDAEQTSHTMNVERIANVLATAAAQRTHDKAWAWVVLPTFPRQHYGRILLMKIETRDPRYPIFVTQPFFLSSEATQFHTHGQNWAFATPLGSPNKSCSSCCRQNTHINTLWFPHSPEQAFPLQLLEKTYYGPGTVAVIPPRIIHGISGVRAPEMGHTLQALTDDSVLRQNQIAQAKFGEMACLHIYRPDWTLSNRLKESPYVHQQERFFIENEMIVFDHRTRTIWSGCGGAWAKRMIQLGPTGEHCATCFSEADQRQENLDAKQVYEWLIQDPPPALLIFSPQLH